MHADLERNSLGHAILSLVGHDSRLWNKGRCSLRSMLDAIERLSPNGEFFTKTDLRKASGVTMPAVYDLLSKLADYEKIEIVHTTEPRPDAGDVYPAPARYRLRPGAGLSRFREIVNAYEQAKAE